MSDEQRPASVPAPSAPSTAASKPAEVDDWQPRLWSRIIILALVVIYLIAFVVSNDHRVGIDFLVGTVDISLLWLVIGTFVLGLVSGMLLSQLYRKRRARARAKATKP